MLGGQVIDRNLVALRAEFLVTNSAIFQVTGHRAWADTEDLGPLLHAVSGSPLDLFSVSGGRRAALSRPGHENGLRFVEDDRRSRNGINGSSNRGALSHRGLGAAGGERVKVR